MKLSTWAVCLVGLGALLTFPDSAVSQDSVAASKLQVRVSYTGASKVDEQHKIHVVLWDSPDFAKGGGSAPVEILSTSSKDGVVTFNDVKKTPAYVSAVYDPSGNWDEQSAPPEGSILCLYSKTPGQPAPIDLKASKTTAVELPFDDSVKMQSGKPAK